MNWTGIYSLLKGIAGLAGVVTFVAFVYTFYKDVQLRHDAINQSWQESEIYRVLLLRGVDGLSFEDLVREVQSSYFDSGIIYGIDTSTARQDAIRRGLIGLSAKNSVTLNNDETFAVVMRPKAYLLEDYSFASRELCAKKLFALVSDFPGRFSANELQQECMDDGLAHYDAHKVLYNFIFSSPPVFIPHGDDPATPIFEESYSPDVKLKLLQ